MPQSTSRSWVGKTLVYVVPMITHILALQHLLPGQEPIGCLEVRKAVGKCGAGVAGTYLFRAGMYEHLTTGARIGFCPELASWVLATCNVFMMYCRISASSVGKSPALGKAARVCLV